MRDAVSEVFGHVAHEAAPGRQRLRRGGGLGVLVVPLPQLGQLAGGILLGVETVAETEGHYDVDAVLCHLGDSLVGLGVDRELALRLLDPVPVDGVVVVADACPLETRIPVQRPQPAVMVVVGPKSAWWS